MKHRIFAILLALALLLSGCAAQTNAPSADILATTAPLLDYTGKLIRFRD